MKRIITIKIFMFFIFIANFLPSYAIELDTCLPKGFAIAFDSSITINGNKVRITNFDFTDNNEQIIIAQYSSMFNLALIKKNQIWETVFIDSILNDNKMKLKHNPKGVSDYKRVGSKIFCLHGWHGFVLSESYDSITHKYITVDTLAGKSYITVADLNDYSSFKIIPIDEYYTNQFFFFDNYGWIVVGEKYIYKFSINFDSLYEKIPNKPETFLEYQLMDRLRWYLTQICYAVSQDTIYFQYTKYIDTIKNADVMFYENVLYKTSDGCKTFEKINLPINKFGYLYFFDSNVGFFSGQYYYYDSTIKNTGMIFFVYKTTDGGKSWQNLVSNDNHKISLSDPYRKKSYDIGGYMKFYRNNKIGVIVSKFAEIYLSYDYGNSWTQINPYDPTSGCDTRTWLMLYSNTLFDKTIYFNCSEDNKYFTYTNSDLTDVDEQEICPVEKNGKFVLNCDYFNLNNILKNEYLDNLNVQIYSLTGELLKNENVTEKRIDFSTFPIGCYTIIINNTKRLAVLKCK